MKVGDDDNGVTFRGTEGPKTKRPPVRIAAHFAGTGWKARRQRRYRAGDNAAVAGTVDYFANGVVHLKDCCLLTK